MGISIKTFHVEDVLAQVSAPSGGKGAAASSRPHAARRTLAELIDWGLTRIHEQGRNGTVFDIFCQARDAGYTDTECEAILPDVVRRFGAARPKDHPYTEEEARSSLRQAFGQARREPWIRDGAIAVPFSTMKPKPVSWVVLLRVPAGEISLLAGDPGLGKSQMTVSWAAEVTTGSFMAQASDVLMISGEDSPERTTLPRLQAAGADLARVHLMQMWRGGEESWITLPDDLAEMERLIQQKKVRLVVIDPVNAFFNSGVDPWKDTAVRQVLGKLKAVAERTGASIVLVMHLTKSNNGGEAIHRVLGSVGYVGQARSVLLLTRDPDDPKGEQGSQRALAHAKCNIGPLAPSLIYEITPASLPNGIETSYLERRGESPHGARDLLAMTHRGSPGNTKRKDARDLLQDELEDDEWHSVTPIKAKAEAFGISEATLGRAKSDLGVEHRVVKGTVPPVHEWRRAPPSRGDLLELFPEREDRRDD